MAFEYHIFIQIAIYKTIYRPDRPIRLIILNREDGLDIFYGLQSGATSIINARTGIQNHCNCRQIRSKEKRRFFGLMQNVLVFLTC